MMCTGLTYLPQIPSLHHGHDEQSTRPRSFLEQLLLPDRLNVDVLALGLHHVLGHALLNLVLQSDPACLNIQCVETDMMK